MILPPGVPELIDLDLLLCVGREGSLSKAAREHGVSQPAASMRIRAVERRLGLQLLERSPSGSRLTSAGRMVVQWAQEVVDAAGELATRVSNLRDDRRERLRIAASATVSDYSMPNWLVTLAQLFPELSVELHVQNPLSVMDQVSSRQCDLGFVEIPSAHSDLAQSVVADDELAVVVAPDHPWSRRQTPITPSELKAGPLVVHEKGAGARETLELALGSLSNEHLNYELASTNAIKAAVQAGSGAAVLSVLAVRDELRSGRLVRVCVSEIDLVCQLRAMWRSNSELSPPAQALMAIASKQGRPGAQRPNGERRSMSGAQRPTRLGQERIPANAPPAPVMAKHEVASA